MGDCLALVFRREGAEVFDEFEFVLAEVSVFDVGRFGLRWYVLHLDILAFAFI